MPTSQVNGRMRRRVTFIHDKEDAIDPSEYEISSDSLQIRGLKAAREDRWTASLYELPQEEVYTKPAVQSERFASSAAFQYHEFLPPTTLNNLSVYIKEKICSKTDRECQADAASIVYAAYIDIDYDVISHAFTLAVFFPEPVRPDVVVQSSRRWEAYMGNYEGSVKTEVGILNNEMRKQSEELSLSGFLVTLGQETKPKPTLFSFPSRHQPISSRLGSDYSAGFITPTGLHPKLRLLFSAVPESPGSSCALHTYLTIPSFLFLDKYQLSSANFLASNNLRALRALSGETDLEAPDWAVSRWGSAILLELAPPSMSDGKWHADIPLHLRYLPPAPIGTTSYARGLSNLSVPWPVIFWACVAEEGTKMSTNPFDRVNLGYDGLFGPKTMFYHLQSLSNGSLVESISVPVLDLESSSWIESGTVGLIVVGFAWLCWRLAQILDKDPEWKGSKKSIKGE
ncbi:MAG: hypothetical protein Q9217_002695 [Psora testacea]